MIIMEWFCRFLAELLAVHLWMAARTDPCHILHLHPQCKIFIPSWCYACENFISSDQCFTEDRFYHLTVSLPLSTPESASEVVSDHKSIVQLLDNVPHCALYPISDSVISLTSVCDKHLTAAQSFGNTHFKNLYGSSAWSWPWRAQTSLLT